MFLTVGERINSSRTSVARALSSRDEGYFRKEAALQKACDARMIDINCAVHSENESADMQWLIGLVQDETDLPVSIDSPDARVIRAGLECHKGKALINSITLEEGRAREILPLVSRFDASVIMLCMDEKGMPHTGAERRALAERAVGLAASYDIAADHVYLDPLIRPLSSEGDQAREALDAVIKIKAALPEARLICGLSNVSFGLPERGLVNAVYLAMLRGAGLDAAILDVANKKISTVLTVTRSVLGEDEFCMKYLEAYRAGSLQW